ncbi:MAG: hypothetical protein ACK5C4_13075 [Pseudanabaena sp.]|jgi:hypothetical protein
MGNFFSWLIGVFTSLWNIYPFLTVGIVFVLLSFCNLKLGGEIISLEIISFPKRLRIFFLQIGFLLIIIEGILLIRYVDISNLSKYIDNPSSRFFKQDIVYEFQEIPKESEVNELISNYFDINFLNSLYGQTYNLEEAKKYITGERYKQTEGCEKEECKQSIKWLKSRNAYFRFGTQKTRIIRQFISEEDKGFYLDIFVKGTYLFYQNRKLIESESKSDYCRLSTFKLAKEGSNLKIAKLVSVTPTPCQ